MSYNEYFDMFYAAQKVDCPYRAFTFDVVNSKNQEQYIYQHDKYIDCIMNVYSLLEREEKLTGKQILLKDKFNNKLELDTPILNSNYFNPMILGDMVTYFVYNKSITSERMLELFSQSLKEYNISYPFHFKSGVYQTNNYGEGGEKLYKGYMPRILEDLSKKESFVVSKNTFKKEGTRSL